MTKESGSCTILYHGAIQTDFWFWRCFRRCMSWVQVGRPFFFKKLPHWSPMVPMRPSTIYTTSKHLTHESLEWSWVFRCSCFFLLSSHVHVDWFCYYCIPCSIRCVWFWSPLWGTSSCAISFRLPIDLLPRLKSGQSRLASAALAMVAPIATP